MSEKILFLDFFQPFAQYRNPFTFECAQSFPLPPKTTIIGFLQNITDRYYDPDFWNIEVSIHGYFESIFWNYQNLIKGEICLDKKGRLINKQDKNITNNWYLLYNSKIRARRSPTYQQELFNGRIFIFLKGKEDILDEIKNCLSKKILRIGRSEDVAFLNHANFTEKSETKTIKKSLKLEFPMYLKRDIPLEKNILPVYYIPTKTIFKNDEKIIKSKYEIIKSKTKRETYFESVYYTNFNEYLILKDKLNVDIFEREIYFGETKYNIKFKIPKPYGWL